MIAAFLRWCVTEHQRFENRKEMQVGPFFIPKGDLTPGTVLFHQYLNQQPEDVRQALMRIVPTELQAELQVENWGWTKELLKAFDLATQKVIDRLTYYETQIQQAAAEEKFSRADALKKIRNTIFSRDLINFFGQHIVLPKYGFPVDVVEFITDYVPDAEVANRVELQRDLRVAISEFAPGSRLVAAKKVWTGGGIYKVPDKAWEPESFAICPECRRFNLQPGDEPILQCYCGRNLPANSPRVSGVMIRPEFGFLAAPQLAEPGDARPPRLYASRVYFSDYVRPQDGIEVSDLDHEETFKPVIRLTRPNIMVATRYSRYGQLVLVNHGPEGYGFHICPLCGFAQPVPATSMEQSPVGSRQRRGRQRQTIKHNNPRNGNPCSGENPMQRRLGHSFITDVLEIQMSGPLAMHYHVNQVQDGKDVWFSLLYTLIEGASQALGIRRDDLNGTIYYDTPGTAPSLLLYDDVPGGAGHMRRVNEALPEVFQAAYHHVAGCECGQETACHQCLWNFRNQPFHGILSRGLATEFLRKVIEV